MTEVIDLQGCEHCSKEFPIETMRMMEDCWFCEACTNEFQEAFKFCEHKWSSHTDTMGDPGKYCEKCCGFVRDEDFPSLFPHTMAETIAETINRCFMMAWDEFGDDKSTEFLVQITADRLGIEPEEVYEALADCHDDHVESPKQQ